MGTEPTDEERAKCCPAMLAGHQCVRPIGHGGDHSLTTMDPAFRQLWQAYCDMKEERNDAESLLLEALGAATELMDRNEELQKVAENTDRILWNERGEEIDEIVVEDCSIHVEQMSDRHWWMAVYKGGDGHRFVLDFTVKPGRRKAMTCNGYDDSIEDGPWIWAQDEDHEPLEDE